VTAAQGVLLVIFVGVAAYAVLGGADFGAGIWYGLATGRHRHEYRGLALRAMGPVWEANHTWLVFVLIGLFSGFPGVFAGYSRALLLPLALALTAIVLRGAAFAFIGAGSPRRWGAVFAVSSLAAPYPFGSAAGAMVAGALPADGSGGLLAPFLTPTAVAAGLLASAISAFVAAVFLSHQAAGDSPRLVAGLYRRAVATAVLLLVLAVAVPVSLAADDPARASFVARQSMVAAVVVSAALLASGYLLGTGRYALARLCAGLVAVAVLAGWAAVIYPGFGLRDLDVSGAAAPATNLRLTLGILIGGLAIVVPAMLLLFRTFRPATALPGDHRTGAPTEQRRRLNRGAH
jgi:cytochrome d ubiquinol oxidase subunit II